MLLEKIVAGPREDGDEMTNPRVLQSFFRSDLVGNVGSNFKLSFFQRHLAGQGSLKPQGLCYYSRNQLFY